MSYTVGGAINELGGSFYVLLSQTRIAVLDTTAIPGGQHRYLWINRVNVPAEFRGRGIGSLLMTTMIDKARAAGFKVIKVTPGGYDHNRKADQIRFYERHGFTKGDDGIHVLDLIS